MFKKIVLILALLLTVVVGVLALYVFTAGPEITDDMKHTIRAAIKAPVQKQTGAEGYAMNGDTRIWYDVQNPKDSIRGSVVLIMGLSADALAWPSFFMDRLLEADYQVIRLDNRGVGMTDWDAFDPENPYSLSDMGNDVLAVLDTLHIQKAHICGVSLGGMIAQTLAIEHPDRVASLISIMSTPDIMDPDLPKLKTATFLKIGMCAIRYGMVKSEENAIKFALSIRLILLGQDKYDLNVERIAQLTLYNLRERNGSNQLAGQQQGAAVERSGSRVEALKMLHVPTLVIHGRTDPLIPFEHGVKTAELIPNAQTLWIDGMGHILSPTSSDTIVARMVALMNATSHTEQTPETE